jgi:hypothetical protein
MTTPAAVPVVRMDTGKPEQTVPYQCYINVTEEEARRAFEKKYGKPPENIFLYARLIWAGPVAK